MIVDGRAIAGALYAELKERVSRLSCAPTLAIITCNPNFETRKYLDLKKKKADEVGIKTILVELGEECVTADFIEAIDRATALSNAIIVQLPLPAHVDTNAVLKAVPNSYDVDALNSDNSTFLSPVVGALNEILKRNNVIVTEKLVTVIGSGRLVGLPASKWLTQMGAHVSVVTKDTADIAYYTKHADIIVCGAGVPGLLIPSMVKEGVIILDAGTSEDSGVLKGDADPSCVEKASLFTPVPGGVGPLTIATLLRNVVDCV